MEGEIYIETYRGEDARHRVSTWRHPIGSESQKVAIRPTSSVVDPPSSTRHPTAPSPLYFTEVNRLWKNYNVAAYLCAI